MASNRSNEAIGDPSESDEEIMDTRIDPQGRLRTPSLSSFEELLDEMHTERLQAGFWQKCKASVKRMYGRYIEPQEGIYLLVFSQMCNSVMVATCKLLETDKNFDTPIHPLQILFARMLITYACCLLYMYLTKSVPHAPLGPKPIRKLLFIRGTVGFLGVFGLYYSLQYLSLSDAVAITFLVPMVTAFLAWVLLHERYSILEGICGLISLAGVLLIAKPNFLFGKSSDSETSDDAIESSSTEKRLLATGVGLVGVCGASSVYIVLRKIGFGAHPLLSVSYFALTCIIISLGGLLLIPSLSFAVPHTTHQWVLFTLIGIFGFLMQFSLTAGVQRVKAARASLITYTHMIFALFWDLVIWGHLPGILSILGIILIIGSAFFAIRYKLKDEQPGDNDVEKNNYDGSESIPMNDIVSPEESSKPESERVVKESRKYDQT